MDDQLNDNESMIAQIQQLERERDELRKDIEQLCMQQAGPSYLAVATRMHFQRTAGLEQDIENLKKNLAACKREKSTLQEELSEAYHIKSQLADLHAAEVAKNMEAEKQVKFFQGCVAAAFAERDQAIIEAEKAKEKEEIMSQKLKIFQKRMEELTSDFHEEKELAAALQIDLEEQKMQNQAFKKVVNKFYEIRQHSIRGFCEDGSWEAKCECLLYDSPEMWEFNDRGETSTSKYIGLEIENHLKKRVHDLEKEKALSEETIKQGISELLHYHSRHRAQIMGLLDEGYSHLQSVIDSVEEKIRKLVVSKEQIWEPPHGDLKPDENDCRDVHVNTIAEWSGPGMPEAIVSGDTSKALAQALQEKVAALLLLSQQEERHLLERNVNAALQKKVEELQRNLLQVTNEKVKALMELAQLKRECQLLQEKFNDEMREGKPIAETGEKKIVQDKDGRLKNLLKKTYLKRWVGTLDSPGDEAEAHFTYEGNVSSRRSNYGMDIARMKVENATLKESLESMEHLTSAVHRLRLSLLKVQESFTCESAVTGSSEALDNIITEAKLVKTALGSSLPVSWSAETDVRSFVGSFDHVTSDVSGDSGNEKVDFVSAAGFEMVETLILAAHALKDRTTKRVSGDGS